MRLKAFKVNSIDYLLKPVQKEELQAAMDKYQKAERHLHGATHPLQKIQALTNLVKELKEKLQPKEYRRRFLVKLGQRLVSMEVEDIAYFFSDGRLNFFMTHGP